MDELARGPAADRAAVFRAAAAERGLPPSHVEKDFWVCWSLRRLFVPPLVEGMVLKGGTSLAKVWGAIQRFSEDIDLTMPRTAIPGAAEIEIGDKQSVSQRKRVKETLDGLLAKWCAEAGSRSVRLRIEAALGTTAGWKVTSSADSLEFEYLVGLPPAEYGTGYVHRSVRFEFGIVMPTEPAEDLPIQPYASRAGRYRMADPEVVVHVLAAERTFWEKATLVHAENHRPEPRQGDRISRHYADLAVLYDHAIGRRALEQIALLRVVAADKERFFYTAWARYDEAGRGSLRLVPPAEHERALRRDYDRMRDMFYGEPLKLETILRRLSDLQETIARTLGRP